MLRRSHGAQARPLVPIDSYPSRRDSINRARTVVPLRLKTGLDCILGIRTEIMLLANRGTRAVTRLPHFLCDPPLGLLHTSVTGWSGSLSGLFVHNGFEVDGCQLPEAGLPAPAAPESTQGVNGQAVIVLLARRAWYRPSSLIHGPNEVFPLPAPRACDSRCRVKLSGASAVLASRRRRGPRSLYGQDTAAEHGVCGRCGDRSVSSFHSWIPLILSGEKTL